MLTHLCVLVRRRLPLSGAHTHCGDSLSLCLSLQTCGSRYIFQSLPRMLTLWFEFGEMWAGRARPPTKSAASSSKSVLHPAPRPAHCTLIRAESGVGSQSKAKVEETAESVYLEAEKYMLALAAGPRASSGAGSSSASAAAGGASGALAPYQWLTALPQVISRLCHPNKQVFKFISSLITTVSARSSPPPSVYLFDAHPHH